MLPMNSAISVIFCVCSAVPICLKVEGDTDVRAAAVWDSSAATSSLQCVDGAALASECSVNEVDPPLLVRGTSLVCVEAVTKGSTASAFSHGPKLAAATTVPTFGSLGAISPVAEHGELMGSNLMLSSSTSWPPRAVDALAAVVTLGVLVLFTVALLRGLH